MGSTGFLEFKYTSPTLVINVQGHHNKLIKLNRPDSLQKNNKRLLLTYIEIKYHKQVTRSSLNVSKAVSESDFNSEIFFARKKIYFKLKRSFRGGGCLPYLKTFLSN